MQTAYHGSPVDKDVETGVAEDAFDFPNDTVDRSLVADIQRKNVQLAANFVFQSVESGRFFGRATCSDHYVLRLGNQLLHDLEADAPRRPGTGRVFSMLPGPRNESDGARTLYRATLQCPA